MNYWVRQDGDDANDGSANDAEHAFLTLPQANSVISTGDYVYVVNVDGTSYEITAELDISVLSYWEGVADDSGNYPKILMSGGVYHTEISIGGDHGEGNIPSFKKFEVEMAQTHAFGSFGLAGGAAWGVLFERVAVNITSGSSTPAIAFHSGCSGANCEIKFCVAYGDNTKDHSGVRQGGEAYTKVSNTILQNLKYGAYWIGAEWPAADSDYNFFYNVTNEYGGTDVGDHDTCKANSNETDPLMIDPASEDFHLQDVSACIDAADPADDNGQTGAHWDTGAYESPYGVAGKPWTSLLGVKPGTIWTPHVARTRPR